jgi:hypothetical protein
LYAMPPDLIPTFVRSVGRFAPYPLRNATASAPNEFGYEAIDLIKI